MGSYGNYPPAGQQPNYPAQGGYPNPPSYGQPQQGQQNFGQPQQGQQNFGQPQYNQPPQGGVPYGQPQQGQQAPQSPGGMPVFHTANDAAMQQAYTEAQTQGSFGPSPQFLKIPGPRGQLNWDNTVPVNYSNHVYIRICSPWAKDKPVFVMQRAHFFKSKKFPKGRVLQYQGEDSLFMRAITLAAQSEDPRLQRVATDYGKVRTQYLYNVIDLSHPEAHFGQDKIMRPFILSAGRQLNHDIGQLVDHRGGITRFCDPVHGRPLKYSKTKTGPEQMNVEYSVIDDDPRSLDPYFYPIFENLWDLEAQIQMPTQDEVLEAIRELGLPMPASAQQVPANYGASYDPNPNPPHANPYGAAQSPSSYGASPPAHNGGGYSQGPNPAQGQQQHGGYQGGYGASEANYGGHSAQPTNPAPTAYQGGVQANYGQSSPQSSGQSPAGYPVAPPAYGGAQPNIQNPGAGGGLPPPPPPSMAPPAVQSGGAGDNAYPINGGYPPR